MDEAATITRFLRAAQAPDTDVLCQPYRLGPFNLRHRIVMAPLTRSRARQPGNVPSSLAACYYAQRASAALIVSEATQVSMQGQGYAWTRGIHSREQVEAWHRIIQTVHQADGWLREGKADLIAFGRKFIANPDLPERLRIGAPFNADDPTLGSFRHCTRKTGAHYTRTGKELDHGKRHP
jgi:2,4-dienoyl-CoA reductase-like NADH-dependent reductase (Old Yellow Enzyme family)